MWPYWLMFGAPALVSLPSWRLTDASRRVMMVVTALVLILVIGLRDRVGEDWSNYTHMLENAATQSLGQLLTAKEPGFGLINWLSLQLGWDQVGVDIFCALIFVSGLLTFLIRQKRPWGCLAIATPILVIELGMSGIRQACAIGVFCMAMNAFADRRLTRYLLFVLLAFTFHQSAILFLPLGLFIGGAQGPVSRYRIALATGLVLVLVLVFGLKDTSSYNSAYIQQSADVDPAAGALPRIAFNVLAATLFLVFRKRWVNYPEFRLFWIFSIIVIALMPLEPFFQVAVDRIEYYLIPFQVAVVMRTAEFFGVRTRAAYLAAVFSGYGFALITWLSLSPIAKDGWEPYRWILS